MVTPTPKLTTAQRLAGLAAALKKPTHRRSESDVRAWPFPLDAMRMGERAARDLARLMEWHEQQNDAPKEQGNG